MNREKIGSVTNVWGGYMKYPGFLIVWDQKNCMVPDEWYCLKLIWECEGSLEDCCINSSERWSSCSDGGQLRLPVRIWRYKKNQINAVGRQSSFFIVKNENHAAAICYIWVFGHNTSSCGSMLYNWPYSLGYWSNHAMTLGPPFKIMNYFNSSIDR